MRAFHLSLPVADLAAPADFYVEALAAVAGGRAPTGSTSTSSATS